MTRVALLVAFMLSCTVVHANPKLTAEEKKVLRQAAQALAEHRPRVPTYAPEQAKTVKSTFGKAFDRKGRLDKNWLVAFNRILKEAGAPAMERPKQEKLGVFTASMRYGNRIMLVEVRVDGRQPMAFVGGMHVDPPRGARAAPRGAAPFISRSKNSKNRSPRLRAALSQA